MTKEETQIGDQVNATNWLGRTVTGVVVWKGRRALVCSQSTRGTYKYKKLELIGKASDELANTVREFVQRVGGLV